MTSDLAHHGTEQSLSAGPETGDSARGAPRAHTLLAWAGWQLEIPRDWQPLKLEGTPAKGQMIVGDSECASFIIKWERPGRKALSDGRQWVEDRLKRHGLLPATRPPAESNFTACGWAEGVQTEESKETTYWYGYAERARLLLGLTVNGALPETLRHKVVRGVLPTLRTTPADGETTWAMYDISCVAQAGFELVQRHLFSGDVALEFARGKRETLLLRQVYPGELALDRRPPEKWLARYPFKEHRRLRRATAEFRPWRHGERPELTGVRRGAWKRLGAPLGWCSPRRSNAIAVHDQRLNRLLIVEHMARAEPDDSVGSTAIEQMNQEVWGDA